MKIAAHIHCEDIVADVGTDHGYLPIWLAQNRAAKRIIISDINEGPLQKAAAHIEKYGVEEKPDMRLGSGLEVLQPGEADVIVIAGMGGILINFILDKSPEVVQSARRLILQPRNHSFDLRAGIRHFKEYTVSDEEIAEEGKRFSEIITVTRNDCLDEEEIRRIQLAKELETELGLERRLFDEVPPLLLVPKAGHAGTDGAESDAAAAGGEKQPASAAAAAGAEKQSPSETAAAGFKKLSASEIVTASGEIAPENLKFLAAKILSELIVINNITENGRSHHAERRLRRAKARLAAFEKMLEIWKPEWAESIRSLMERE